MSKIPDRVLVDITNMDHGPRVLCWRKILTAVLPAYYDQVPKYGKHVVHRIVHTPLPGWPEAEPFLDIPSQGS